MVSRSRAWLAALLFTSVFAGSAVASTSQTPPSAPAPATAPRASAARAATPAPATPGRQASPARLVLYVMVDQFRYDYLTRFEQAYTGGLHRLLRDGAVFTQASLEHYPTVTAPGHATIGTGAMLSTSGIIGNDWYDRESGGQVTSVSDPGVKQLGGSGREPASPHRLLVSTLADEMKMAAEAAGRAPARTFGISLKDRGAILPVGRAADAAYWFDTKDGTFVSSTFYFPDLPDWVKQFNAGKPADSYGGKSWPFWSGATPVPVLPAAAAAGLPAAIYSSPFGNDLLLRFAERLIDAERLGQRDTVDFLSVSFSSNDAVGHTFGPDSPEVRAISLDTDRVLGQLFATIDRLVGLDRTLIVLSADHGVAPLPEYLAAHHMPGGRITGQDSLFAPIEAALSARYGAGKWILSTAGSSPYFDYKLMADRGVDPAEARAIAAKAAAAQPHVARVFTREQLLEGRVPSDIYSQRVLRSYHPRRSGDLEILFDPYWLRQAKGTTHGTPYDYDAHVPLVFLGPGIRAGRYDQRVASVDVAPTFAAMLQIAPPTGTVGRALIEMFTPAGHAPARAARPARATRPAAPPR